MQAQNNCEMAKPIFAVGTVEKRECIESAVPKNSVYCLTLLLKNKNAFPIAGQFFMLRTVASQRLLARPISIFHAEKCEDGILLDFLILVKGKGTQELCSLENGDKVEILGPLGNVFPRPDAVSAVKGDSSTLSFQDFARNDIKSDQKICIIGGGIGVAPVAGFAESLPEGSYDFFACFKSGKYGLSNVHAKNLVITTDDGSEGIKGMLPSALDAKKIRDAGYSAIYACGPEAMLRYVKKIAEEAGVQCYLSMEARMACGVGVCLGCVIPTSEGNLRCCKDGPVFDAKILFCEDVEALETPVTTQAKSDQIRPVTSTEKFDNNKVVSPRLRSGQATAQRPTDNIIPDLSVRLKDVILKNPIIASSGTFGFGTEYSSVIDVSRLGAIVSKGLTLESRQGNSGIRLWETPSGLMNSIGLQNPGISHFIEYELQDMLKFDTVTIANLSGSTMESYTEGAKLLEKTAAPIIELNISCPNVDLGGASFGMTCVNASAVVSAVRKIITKPLIVKLTPQSPEINAVALSCIKAGADAISLCNSFQGVAIDIEKGKPVFDKVKAGFGGPAVRPIAVRLIYELAEEIKKLPENEQVPIFAIGGVANYQDVVEFIMAGATAVEVGTNTFANPFTMIECIDGLSEFMKRKGYRTIDEMRGIALQH